MRLSRKTGLLIAVLLCLALCPGWARAETRQVQGRALYNGRGLAGVIVSNGHEVAASGADGFFQIPAHPGAVVWAAAPPDYAIRGPWWFGPSQARGGKLVFKLARAKPNRGSLVFMSDPHLFGPGQFKEARLPALKRGWGEAVSLVRRLKPAIVVLAGDISMNMNQLPLPKARKQMDLAARYLKLLPHPWRGLPGNHDIRPPGGAAPGLALWHARFGPARHIFRLPGTCLVLMGGLHGEPSRAQDTLAWLKRILALLPRKEKLILVTHHPLAAFPGAPPELLSDIPKAGKAVLKLAGVRRIMAVISGHWHTYYGWRLPRPKGGAPMIGLPAVCGPWWDAARVTPQMQGLPGLLEARPTPHGLRFIFHRLLWSDRKSSPGLAK